ncbi:enoyl-CoA hydratase, partial [archaeon]
MKVNTEAGVRTITINRPEKRNALTLEMYHHLTTALTEAGGDPAVRVVVLTGAGSFFSSGNDLSNFTSMASGGMEAMAETGRTTLHS